MRRNYRKLKFIAIFLLVNFLIPIITPTMSWALTSGPSSPEFSSFEPVATTDMVNAFSGDFTYNLPVVSIPGPNGAGYSLALSYHSGVSSEEEASWVGYGWSLNPGAINRGKVGYPDDFKDVDVKKYNKTRPNWSASASVDGSIELYSKDFKKEEGNSNDSTRQQLVGLSANKSIRFNNYQGFSKTVGYGVNVAGIGFNMSRNGSDVTFSTNVVYAVLNYKENRKRMANRKKCKVEEADLKGKNKKLSDVVSMRKSEKMTGKERAYNIGSSYVADMLRINTYPVSLQPSKGVSFNTSQSLELNFYVPIGLEFGYTRNFNIQVSPRTMNMKAFGYMNNPNRDMYDMEEYQGESNDAFDPISTILSDYSVERNNPYTKLDYYLGIPYNGADNFMLTGEGLSGGFRLFHEKVGHYYPNFVRSKMNIQNIGVEFGAGPGNIEIGMDFGMGFQRSKMEDWRFPNGLIDACSVLDAIQNDVDHIEATIAIIEQLTGITPEIQGVSPDDVVTLFNEIINQIRADYACGHQFETTDLGFFRFNNDMGGKIEYSTTNALVSAKLPMNASSLLPGLKYFSPHLGPLGIKDISSKSGRSSYIDYRLNNSTDTIEKDTVIQNLVKENTNVLTMGIREFGINNETGLKYVYGLPVYTKNEKSLTTEIMPNDDIDNKYLVYKADDFYVGDEILTNKTVMGESIEQAYAINHLLTQITTPDYLDVTDNGPTDDDFGGWTKFQYRKWKSENDNEWYHFRTPYCGMSYDKNQISNKRDDMASVTSGDKQKYYLKAIETKTHVAFFVTNKSVPSDFSTWNNGDAIPGLTGSGVSRYDGCGAVRETSTTDPAAKGIMIDATQKPEKLERIVIFSKNRLDKPLQTVNFAYDYGLCKNLPNNVNRQTGDASQSGKLTLKKVWFESEGIVKNKTAPYEFYYAYPQPYSQKIKARYPDISMDQGICTDVAQNPDYKPFALDMWGNYQINGEERHDDLVPWTYQGDFETTDQFDPAAWNLKRIVLPSGGEIHVQYEQDDYCWVQNQPAMAMVSILPESEDAYDYNETKYYLNLKDIGLVYTDPNDQPYIDKLKMRLENHFIAQHENDVGNFVYFKFLYTLFGERSPNVDNCDAEYISGYANVNEVGMEGGKIFLKLGNQKGKKNVPRQVCYNYYVTNADGMLEGDDCHCKLADFDELENRIANYVEAEIAQPEKEYIIKNQPGSGNGLFRINVAWKAVNKVTFRVADRIPKKNEVCKHINYPLSKIKIPMFEKSKRGGGIRVKRLLMYDNGIETGEECIYGTEYTYKETNGLSSGVATNEPASGHEESALVGILDRKDQKWLSKIIAGEDRTQIEGPLGEELLPAPSVGYSKVIIQNIHTGKTGTGYQVYDYFTAKDYPMQVEYTKIKDNRERDWITISVYQGMFNYNVDKYWLTQGYKFVLNSMHGAQKKVSSYYGSYDGSESGILSSYTKYDYVSPGTPVLMLNYDPEQEEFKLYQDTPGKEEDITMEMKGYKSKVMDISLEVDVSISFPTPSVSVSFMPSFAYQENNLFTHVTSKVIKWPTILRNTTSYMDGWTTKTENLAYNPHNGSPVVSKTYDGYDGLYVEEGKHNGAIYNWQIPGSWVYPELGQKDENSSYVNNLSATVGSITTYGDEGNWFQNFQNGTWNISTTHPKGVISAEAVQLCKDWFTGVDDIISLYNIPSGALVELDNVYRTKANYTYKTDVISSNKTNATGEKPRIYNGGVYTGDFTMFDWSSNNAADQGPWMMISEVTKYSPDGNALEERNILGIYSTARYGYGKLLPVIVAQNATYNSVFFNGYETDSLGDLNQAHSGVKSVNYRVNSYHNFVDGIRDNIKLTSQMVLKGSTVKLWMKSYADNNSSFINTAGNLQVKVNNTISAPFKKIASSGEWSLYEANITDWSGIQAGATLNLTIDYAYQGSEQVYIDDFCMQPKDAQVMCSVYDLASFRLLAQFGDQHFGSFYQYNAEGKLVRKLIETERGIKTVQETQYNTPQRLLIP